MDKFNPNDPNGASKRLQDSEKSEAAIGLFEGMQCPCSSTPDQIGRQSEGGSEARVRFHEFLHSSGDSTRKGPESTNFELRKEVDQQRRN